MFGAHRNVRSSIATLLKYVEDLELTINLLDQIINININTDIDIIDINFDIDIIIIY